MVLVLIRQGGLMRCCTETAFLDAGRRSHLPQEGEKLHCPHCDGQMVYRDEAWQWDRPAPTKRVD